MPQPSRKATEPVTTPDPLADLRAPEDAQQGLSAPEPPAGSTDTPEAPEGAQDPAEAREQAVQAIVTAWHADDTGKAFGHGGGTCGCRYLASLAVLAMLALAEAEDERRAQDEDGEPSG